MVHTRNGLDGEVTKAADHPGILIRGDEPSAIVCFCQEIKEELGVSLDGINPRGREKPVSRA